jgi:hypothetical protein
MTITTQEYRDLIDLELLLFERTETLAQFNKRYSIKAAAIVCSPKQIVCGNFASFRVSKYEEEYRFHPEYAVLDLYNSETENLTFYVAKLNINNVSLPSRPCKRCMLEIKENTEIQAIVYRDDKLRIVKESLE